jgi:hypothetical protein
MNFRWARPRPIWGFLAALGVSGCSLLPAPAPQALSGAWARGPGACAAGFVIRFESDRVVAEGPDGPFTLLADVDYRPRDRAGQGGVTVQFALPSRKGGVSGAGGRGEVDLDFTAGRLAPRAERYLDLRTGAMRAPLTPGVLSEALDLAPCGGANFAAEARGRI